MVSIGVRTNFEVGLNPCFENFIMSKEENLKMLGGALAPLPFPPSAYAYGITILGAEGK